MKKAVSFRHVLSISLVLIFCFGCCTQAFAYAEPAAYVQPAEEPTSDSVTETPSDFYDFLLIDKLIIPLTPDMLILWALSQLPLIPFRWLGEKLSDAWDAIVDAFWTVEMFFSDLFNL